MVYSLTAGRAGRFLMASVLALALLMLPIGAQLAGDQAWAMERQPLQFERPTMADVPEQVVKWLESVRERQGLYKFDYDGKTWVAAAWGAKPTGGYTVTIAAVERTGTEVIVLSVELVAPSPGDITTQVITYPYDLIAIDQDAAPLAAEFSGAPWATEQEGTPLASQRVFLELPAAGAVLRDKVHVKGAAQLFEGTFHVVLEDGHNQLINELGTASAGGPEWGIIDEELEFPVPTSPHGLLIITWQDARDGSWVEELAVPVSFAHFERGGDDEAASAPFSDVAGHWAATDIAQAVEQGFVNGYPDGTFKPDAQLTRAEFIKMLSAAMGIAPVAAREAAFADTSDHWARDYIEEALRRGILIASDYGSEFEPDKEITRLEIAQQIVRALQREADLSGYADKANAFTDAADLDAAARAYIGAAVELSVMNGYPDNTVRPDGQATRAEAVVMVQRAAAAAQVTSVVSVGAAASYGLSQLRHP